MRTLFLISVSLSFISNSLFAQPTLSQNDIGFQIGDTQVNDSLQFMDMSAGEGANMTWNLNGLELMGTLIYSENLEPSDTDAADLFPTSTVARKIITSGIEIDQFFNYDSESMQHLGTSLLFSGQEINSIYTNPEIAFPTPMAFGDSGSDSYASEIMNGPGGDTETSGVINWEVPGYGTLLVNGETYSDVLMYTWTRWDTTTVTFSGFEFTTFSEEVTYTFMKAGYHYPLVVFTEITSEDEFTEPVTTYEGSVLVSQTTTGIDDYVIAQEITMYPNPNNGVNVQLQFDLFEATELQVDLLSIDGRIISTLLPLSVLPQGNNNHQLELPSHLSRGLYLIAIRNQETILTELLELN